MTAHGRRPVVLAGPMGAGKTSAGRLAARWLALPFDDLDALIERREGCRVRDLFARGEPAFRAAERRALRGWLEEAQGPRLLALGGGTLEDAGLRAALERAATILHLDAPGAELAARLGAAERAARPLLAGAADAAARLEELRAARAGGYAAAALRVDTAGLSREEAAVALLRALYDPDEGPWRAAARPVDPRSPEVTSGRGALPFAFPGGAVALFDRNLPAVHRRAVEPRLRARAGGALPALEVEGGEAAKSPAALQRLWEALLAAGAERGTALVVAGGGSLTDLGGLAAHTFKRGLPLHLLPTTLLGQVDAALGGKNGINLGGVKNVVGTVRLPEAVQIDPLFALTLGEADYRGGLAEAIKCALIGDPELLDLCERERPALAERRLDVLEEIAARAAAVKLQIVARDLEERGERRLLNLGHTLGHALEAAAAAAAVPLPHGDAVAAGMVAALALSRRRGLLADRRLEARLRDLLRALGLPDAPPPALLARGDAVTAALAQDKKRSGGRAIWVLVRAAGDLRCEPVPDEEIGALLEEFR